MFRKKRKIEQRKLRIELTFSVWYSNKKEKKIENWKSLVERMMMNFIRIKIY